MSGEQLGIVVGGSLTKTLEVRLAAGQAAGLGEYLMVPLEGEAKLLGMVTDVLLRAAEPGATSWPPAASGETGGLLLEVLMDTAVYAALEVNPYLEIDEGQEEPSRARRLPRHFAPAFRADQRAIETAFGTRDRPSLSIGAPLGMDDIEVCVDFDRLFERSVGVFGKSGTGKTVLAFQLLDAMVAHSRTQSTHADKTVALIFDMHNDYGKRMKFEAEGSRERRSLKQNHPSDVAVYSLEKNAVDVESRIVIGTRDIDPEDLAVLQVTAEFTAAAIEAAHDCKDRFGRDWLDEILKQDPSPHVLSRTWPGEDPPEEPSWAKVVNRMGIHGGSFQNLQRGLRKLRRREFVESGDAQFDGVIRHIIQTLRGGKSVVIQFGAHGNDLVSYMLVANMLSRRIWEEYQRAVERASDGGGDAPNRLVIVIEEAHKFMDRTMREQSIFGQIARELRKYNVTLFVIDQRPSQIDPEVLSQIGTKVCLQLDSDADIEALVGGMTGRAGLRAIIASLESKQQALAFGHALPMPVVVRPPTLDPNFRPGGSLRDRLNAVAPPEAAGRVTIFGRRSPVS
ncbi:hypothetical protein AYO38_02120 [bacterium SCGC AG-212-C10]|nr:hypothetical protein AYO38_02120 [bacterium SCGC AG-212-C10]